MNRLLLLLLLVCGAAFGQTRSGTDEWSLNVFAIGPKQYFFEGGATARNDGGAGIGLILTRNVNDYFAFGLEASLSEFNYRATITSGGTSFSTDGNMETGALRAHFTWNLLARPFTPFLTANAGVMILDPSFDREPPADACWNYPWYGQACSDRAPTTALARFTYGVGTGLRYELPREQGFLRAIVGAEWIDFKEALSTVGYVVVRADFGIRF